MMSLTCNMIVQCQRVEGEVKSLTVDVFRKYCTSNEYLQLGMLTIFSTTKFLCSPLSYLSDTAVLSIHVILLI